MPSSPALLALGQRWANAERDMDVAALDHLLDADFLAIGPLGFVLHRAQWLDRYRSGLRTIAFGWDDVDWRELGETAIAIGVQDQQATYQGRDTSGRFRVSLVCVRRAADWRIAHIQLSGPLMPRQAQP